MRTHLLRNTLFTFKSLTFFLLVNLFVTHEALALPWKEMNKLGESKLRVAFWDIYDAELYTTGNAFDQNKPFALKLTYLRDFSKESLVKETKKQLKELNLLNERNNEQWFTRLLEIWVDVEKGDSITLYSNPQREAVFYHNQNYLGKIDDKEFSKRFAAIWLSELTTQPEMRRELLGQR